MSKRYDVGERVGHWNLLVQQMLKDGIVTRVSPETVRQLLKKQTQTLASKELVNSRSYSGIHYLMDNLNIHHYHSLVEFFGEQEADRIMRHFVLGSSQKGGGGNTMNYLSRKA